MGFLDGLGRMIQGKPLFEDPGQSDGRQAVQVPHAETPQQKVDRFGSPIDDRGYKIIPEIDLEHLECHRDGDHQTVTAWITNRSDQRVRIDYARLLSQKRELHRELEPGKSHDFTLYKGRTPTHDHDSRAELVFRLMGNTDEFMNVYYVEFHREADGGYLVEEFHPEGPTRDI